MTIVEMLGKNGSCNITTHKSFVEAYQYLSQFMTESRLKQFKYTVIEMPDAEWKRVIDLIHRG